MDLTEGKLLALVETGEGKALEFKRGLQRGEKIARTLAAFANTRGGILLVGVGDRGEVLGAPRPKATARELAAIAAELVEPPLEVEVSIVRAEGRTVVCCSVPLSAARPHAVVHADGTREVVVRAGSSNRMAGPKALEGLRAARTPARALTELERVVLAWVAQRGEAGMPATSVAFAAESGVGKQRARSAFMALERAGKLVGHGVSAERTYRCA